jgi:hypothetical protein
MSPPGNGSAATAGGDGVVVVLEVAGVEPLEVVVDVAEGCVVDVAVDCVVEVVELVVGAVVGVVAGGGGGGGAVTVKFVNAWRKAG